MGKTSNNDTITIKIKRGTHTALSTLIKRLATEGWSLIGEKRTDAPTYATVAEIAVKRLADDAAVSHK